MRRKSINLIKENEILAKDIYGSTDTILMAAGMILKKEYIERLKQLNIDYVFVEDELPRQIMEQETIEERIKMHCQKAIENVYERYSYCGNVELKELISVANQVIFEVLKEPNVLYCIENVRQTRETVYNHSLNVCAMSVLVALKMGLSQTQIEDIAIGSLIHDIGYLYLELSDMFGNIPDYMEREMQSIKKHVIFGYTEVENESWLSKKAKNIILSHHEYQDGTGYPLKLSGNDIDIETKIVTVCNEFERMIYGKSSKKVKSHEAIEYVIAQSGFKYDPRVVQAFCESIARYPNGTRVKTSDGEIAVVVRQNIDFPSRPVIRILKGKEGEDIVELLERDLVEELSLFIEELQD